MSLALKTLWRWLPLCCLVSTAAWAIPTNRPKIAVHPLKVGSGSPGEQKELKIFYKVMVSALEEIETPLEPEVVQALEKNGYASCDRDDECLRRVAVATGSVYAVYTAVGLDGLGDNVVAAARIVRSDAQPIGKGVTLTRPLIAGRRFSEVAKEVLTALVAELKLPELPASLPAVRSPAADAPVVMVTPPVASASEVPVTVVDKPGGKIAWRWAGYGTAGAAVVMGVVGGVVLAGANGTMRGVQVNDGAFANAGELQRALAASGQQKVGVGLVVGAGVLAAASAAAFWVSVGSDETVATVQTDGRGALVLWRTPL